MEFYKYFHRKTNDGTSNDICTICLEEIETPITLPCGHSYCTNCITDYIEYICKKRKRYPKCPLCRKIMLPRNRDDVNQWKVTFIVMCCLMVMLYSYIYVYKVLHEIGEHESDLI